MRLPVMRTPALTALIAGDFSTGKLIFAIGVLLLAIDCRAVAQQSGVNDEVHYDPVKITNGPVVEYVTDTTAQIAWSTNVNSSTLLLYGENPDFLDKTGKMPWGGITHRVYLKGLKPGTKYYFQAESGQGQGTGTKATAEIKSFQTK